jgi:hypothetical protein
MVVEMAAAAAVLPMLVGLVMGCKVLVEMEQHLPFPEHPQLMLAAVVVGREVILEDSQLLALEELVVVVREDLLTLIQEHQQL